ncbi:MAG: saccharopine dehydrogenase family protein [Lentisphaeria bacterium]|nr:saccharopine dehydrogenase family protein [Lentisphaeria bacterium]
MSKRVLIIGAGGVGSVVAHKCAQTTEFQDICIACRNEERAKKLAAQLPRPVQTASVDADDVPALVKLLKSFKPDVVINVALPYQDLHIMDACLEAGVNYVDTANYEPPETAHFEYSWQWAYQERFKEKGLMALLGSGFDPGVSNVYCAWAKKKHFDTIEQIDIIDANAGDNGQPFATNFNPEINIREVSAPGRYWENGEWITTKPLEIKRTYNFPTIGDKNIYLMYHEELESLTKNFAKYGVKRARFWMTFSDNYLNHLNVLKNVGMTRIDPVMYEGKEIIPLQFLKKLLPDPATLGPLTKGKTCIGCVIQGTKDGKPRTYYIYNLCDHQEAYREVQSQAISYTTGVPAMIGALLVATGVWKGAGVFNMEDFDPAPFMEKLTEYGLPWIEQFEDVVVP